MLLYFLQGRQAKVKHADLASLGLSHVVDGAADPPGNFANDGPGGKSGYVLSNRRARHDPSQVVGYYADKQEWVESGRDGLWVGWWKEQPPTPESLRRAGGLAGAEVTLADGRAWEVPVLREWIDAEEFEEGEAGFACVLPMHLRKQGGRWLNGEVRREYRGLWSRHLEAAQTLLDAIIKASADGRVTHEVTDALCDHAVELLAVNYQLSELEVSALGLLDTNAYVAVVKAATEMDKYLDYALRRASAEAGKKKAGGGEDASPPPPPPGGPGSPPATDPAGATSPC